MSHSRTVSLSLCSRQQLLNRLVRSGVGNGRDNKVHDPEQTGIHIKREGERGGEEGGREKDHSITLADTSYWRRLTIAAQVLQFTFSRNHCRTCHATLHSSRGIKHLQSCCQRLMYYLPKGWGLCPVKQDLSYREERMKWQLHMSCLTNISAHSCSCSSWRATFFFSRTHPTKQRVKNFLKIKSQYHANYSGYIIIIVRRGIDESLF